jgi:hypothetical protein
MIIIGSRGRRTHGFLMGSVSREIANSCEIPVLIARKEGEMKRKSVRRHAMTCPFLKGTFIPVCTVYGDNYLPSKFELEKYCQSGKAGTCPYPTLRLYGIGHTNQSGARCNLPKEAA